MNVHHNDLIAGWDAYLGQVAAELCEELDISSNEQLLVNLDCGWLQQAGADEFSAPRTTCLSDGDRSGKGMPFASLLVMLPSQYQVSSEIQPLVQAASPNNIVCQSSHPRWRLSCIYDRGDNQGRFTCVCDLRLGPNMLCTAANSEVYGA